MKEELKMKKGIIIFVVVTALMGLTVKSYAVESPVTSPVTSQFNLMGEGILDCCPAVPIPMPTTPIEIL